MNERPFDAMARASRSILRVLNHAARLPGLIRRNSRKVSRLASIRLP